MKLRDLLAQIRDLYARRFEEVAARVAREEGGRTLWEVALRDKGGRAVGEGALGLPTRLDLVSVIDDAATKTMSVDSCSLLEFARCKLIWAGTLRVSMHPFQWDAVSIHLQATERPIDWTPLVEWYRRWFREDEDGDGGTSRGLVHFLSDPGAHVWRVQADR